MSTLQWLKNFALMVFFAPYYIWLCIQQRYYENRIRVLRSKQ